MEEIDFKLAAKNSSGEQNLWLGYDEDAKDYYFTLTGEYRGDDIQIDFEALTRSELEDLGVAIQLILDAT